MKFERNKIVVRSTGRFWRKEISGTKPYTVRILDREEHERLMKLIYNDLWIEIEFIQEATYDKPYSRKSFIRRVRDISDLGEFLGKFLVGISWEVEGK